MNKKVLLVVAAVLVVAGLFVYKRMAFQPKQALHLVNVLDKEYFDDCHIPGSVNVTMNKVEKFAAVSNKNDIYVVYCANYACAASGEVAKELVEKGFKNVYAYEAGIADWHAHGYACVGNCAEQYLTAPNVQRVEHAPQGYKVISTEELKSLVDESTCPHNGCSCAAHQ